LGTELNVLLSSSELAAEIRRALLAEDYHSLHFWVGFVALLSAILALITLICTFTAWKMIASVSEANAYCIFRSSIGQYASDLPRRLIVLSIYSFIILLGMFIFLLLPVGTWSLSLIGTALTLFIHTIVTLSGLGRVVMHSGAMESEPIFEKSYESKLDPGELYSKLIRKARINRMKGQHTSSEDSASRGDNITDDFESCPNGKDEKFVPVNHRTKSGISVDSTMETYPPIHRSGIHMLDERMQNSDKSKKNIRLNSFHAPTVKTIDGSSSSEIVEKWFNLNSSTTLTQPDDKRVPISGCSKFQKKQQGGIRSFGIADTIVSNGNASSQNVVLHEISSGNSDVQLIRSSLTHVVGIDARNGHASNSERMTVYLNSDERDDEIDQNLPDDDLPPVEDKDVWYNGIYFGDDDDDEDNNDEFRSENTRLLRQDQMERGKYLSVIPETLKINERTVSGNSFS
jgi:hypothetical protein